MLELQIQGWLDVATAAEVEGCVKVVIVPHAGYDYSAQTAAYSYKVLCRTPWKRLLVLGPSHRSHLTHPCMLSSFTSLETPLGSLAVAPAHSLHGRCFSVVSPEIDTKEHSLEMQYPFIKHLLPDVQVVPIMVGGSGKCLDQCVEWLAAALTEEGTAMVVSSDFCHWGRNYDFYPRLGDGPEKMSNKIRDLDRQALELIDSSSAEAFQDYLCTTGNTICGSRPIELAMKTIKSMGLSGKWEWLHYSQSSELLSFDPAKSSVSYVAGAFVLTNN